MQPIFRAFDPGRDTAHVRRIWQEVGWLDMQEGNNDSFLAFLACGRALVAELDGAAECLVATAPGAMLYQTADMPITCVTAVTTSRTVRKRGIASSLCARALAEEALEGSPLAMLGMFEQGYYNRLGFGTGSDIVRMAFDPAHLTLTAEHRHPIRLTSSDWEELHASRNRRFRVHGGCTMACAGITRGEVDSADSKQFGLGYRDDAGELTHYVWFSPRSVESGPYSGVLVFRTWDQFLELMALIRSLGDQVHLVDLPAPPLIQMQDLLKQPFKHRRISDRGDFRAYARTAAWWQARMLNVPACLERTRLREETQTLNLVLDDPVESLLPAESDWKGIGGEYVLTLGERCSVVPGHQRGLETLRAGVGAFTRMWLGVLSATALSVTDHLSASQPVLERLDQLFASVPRPHVDWDF